MVWLVELPGGGAIGSLLSLHDNASTAPMTAALARAAAN
jgi:hypothetical protein